MFGDVHECPVRQNYPLLSLKGARCRRGAKISVLQVGWQFFVSAKVSFVKVVALVCRLLAVTTNSGLSPAHMVTSFVLLVVLGV